jgi:hypothetical protein
MANPLESLRDRIEAKAEPDFPPDSVERLTIVRCGDLHHVEFYGNPFDEAYSDLCKALSSRETAASVVSLTLRGPDEGANGTREWDLEPLIADDRNFPALHTFHIDLNKPGDHNRTIIGSNYDEGGVIARFASRCPRLASLTVPSAPSSDFFDLNLPDLRFLSVDAGYDPQGFIRNFGRSRGFPNLTCFEWGEYSEDYMDDWQTSCTPFPDYEALVVSSAFRTVNRFVFRQSTLSTQQIKALRSLRPDFQFLLVRFSSEYVRKA